MEIYNFSKISTKIILLIIFLGCFETIDSSALTIWLSEYGSSDHSWETDTIQVTTVTSLPAASDFRTQDNFLNDYVAKSSGTDFTARENTTFVVFTCQSDQPVFWSITKNLSRHVLMPDWYMLTVNLRSSNSSSSVESAESFKSLISIDMSEDWNDYDYEYDLSDPSSFDKLPSYPSWTFTCATSKDYGNMSSVSKSITFRVGVSEGSRHRISSRKTGNLKPEDKIMTAVLKTGADADKKINSTTLHLDDNHSSVTNADANKNHTILRANSTINLGEIYEVDEDGVGHLNFAGNGTVTPKLVEYGKDEGIYEGDSIQIFCYSLHTFYVFGAYLQINWVNGTTSFLQEVHTKRKGIQVTLNTDAIESHPLFGKDADGEGGIQSLMDINLLFYLSQPFEAKREMKSVDCFMPVWSSGADWDKVTRQLNVLPKTHK